MVSSSKFTLKILLGIYLGAFSSYGQAQQIQSVDLTPEFSFTNGIEGPAVDREGNLYVVNFKKQGKIEIVYENGKSTTSTMLPEGKNGNGINFEQGGHMLIVDYVKHSICRIKKGIKQPEIWIHSSEISQPNDLGIAPNGNDIFVNKSVKGTLGINDIVVSVSKNGEVIKGIRFRGKKLSNSTFGGENGKNCFESMADKVVLKHFPSLIQAHFIREHTNLIYII